MKIELKGFDFNRIAQFAYQEFGLCLSESKQPLIEARLAKRVKVRKKDSISEYLDLLEDKGELDERKKLASALTTNVTNFFREPHHFDFYRTETMTALAHDLAIGRRARIWSAGCSSGQEAYTIAMVSLDVAPAIAQSDFRILATDIDPEIIQKARLGVYPNSEKEGIPKCHLEKFTRSGDEGTFEIEAKPRGLITFAELNLVSLWPFTGPFNAIFCRNVAIYFDRHTQEELWLRLVDMLTPGGHLFIGHSERLTGPASKKMHPCGTTAFRKNKPSYSA